jgi:hypothetical protein
VVGGDAACATSVDTASITTVPSFGISMLPMAESPIHPQLRILTPTGGSRCFVLYTDNTFIDGIGDSPNGTTVCCSALRTTPGPGTGSLHGCNAGALTRCRRLLLNSELGARFLPVGGDVGTRPVGDTGESIDGWFSFPSTTRSKYHSVVVWSPESKR